MRLFGATDKDQGDDPFDQWSVMDNSMVIDTSDYSVNSHDDQNETGMQQQIIHGGQRNIGDFGQSLPPVIQGSEKHPQLDPIK